MYVVAQNKMIVLWKLIFHRQYRERIHQKGKQNGAVSKLTITRHYGGKN